MTVARATRLAILVVYLFDDRLAPLVRVHLQRIRRHTSVPYKVYASVHGLSPHRRALLDEFPEVRQWDDPAHPDLRRRADHDWRLTRLREIAAADGATHFLTLHMDSFPVSDRWFDDLNASLKAGDAFAAASPYCYNAMLFWNRAWEDAGAPFLPAGDGEARRAALRAARPDLDLGDGGVGFVIEAMERGLPWRELTLTGPNVWGGLFLHIVGATRLTVAGEAPTAFPKWLRMLGRLSRPVRRRLPARLRHGLFRAAAARFPDDKTEMPRDGSAGEKKNQIDALVADPESFIAACIDPRSGVPDA